MRLVTTAAAVARWHRKPEPAKFVGVVADVIKLPDAFYFQGTKDVNQGAGIILEDCHDMVIDPYRIVCNRGGDPAEGGEAYGIVLSNCHNVRIVSGGQFYGCHSAVMVTDGSRNIYVGDNDADTELIDCWMTDVHGRDCQDVYFRRINGGRIHIGNTGTKELFESGSARCVVDSCLVDVVEFAGRVDGGKLYRSTVAKQVTLYPPPAPLPFSVRLEDLGDTPIETKMLEVK